MNNIIDVPNLTLQEVTEAVSETRMNIMLDLETTGTSPGCCILSIGLVSFDHEKILGSHYISANHESSLAAGFKNDPDTLNWWKGQPKEAKDAAFLGGIHISEAMLDMAEYTKENLDPKNGTIWCQGASFDFPITKYALDTVDISLPWKFWQERCSRTVFNQNFLVAPPSRDQASKHHAETDALHQTKHLLKVWEWQRQGKRTR